MPGERPYLNEQTISQTFINSPCIRFLAGQFNFLLENVCADSLESFEEIASPNAEHTLKFARKSAQPFSYKKANCPIKLGKG